MDLDIYKVIPIAISLIAIFISIRNNGRIKKLDGNSMIRLVIASETLVNDFRSLRTNHTIGHFIPGYITDENKVVLSGSFKKMETKIDLIYDLILKNTEISPKDIRDIIENLEEITYQLEELKNLGIESQDDMEIAKSITNPIMTKIEIVKSILSEYDTNK